MQCMSDLSAAVSHAASWTEHVAALHAAYRAGNVHVHVPQQLHDSAEPLDELIHKDLPAPHAARAAAPGSLFFSPPVAFDPAESAGPYLAIVDRDAQGKPYRFLDMGALIPTQAFGEKNPGVVRAV